MSVLHVACGSGPDYAPHTAAMLHSVLANRGDLDVRATYLRGPSFPEAAVRAITEMVERAGATIAFPVVGDERIAGLPATDVIRPPLWYRIFLPELLPDVDRVLYLDSDCIAVDDLVPLWDTDLGGNVVGAVSNVFEPWNAGRPAVLGLPGPEAYFNSGVLLMDLARMRAEDFTRTLLGHARDHAERLTWLDQDALNVVLAGRWLPLHPRWNCMNSILLFDWAPDVFGEEAVREARENPGIRHFEGPWLNKPWHFLCDRAMKEDYLRHRRATPWPRFWPEGVTAGNLARRLKRSIRP